MTTKLDRQVNRNGVQRPLLHDARDRRDPYEDRAQIISPGAPARCTPISAARGALPSPFFPSRVGTSLMSRLHFACTGEGELQKWLVPLRVVVALYQFRNDKRR